MDIFNLDPGPEPDNQSLNLVTRNTATTEPISEPLSESNIQPSNPATAEIFSPNIPSEPDRQTLDHTTLRISISNATSQRAFQPNVQHPASQDLAEEAGQMIRNIERTCHALDSELSTATTRIMTCRVPLDDDPRLMLDVVDTISGAIENQRSAVDAVDRMAARLENLMGRVPPEWDGFIELVLLDRVVKGTMKHCLDRVERLGREVERLSRRLRMGHVMRHGPPFVRE
ncbi:hypothetical protein GE09DRAFT_317374 [Coniochaeta sp. 2T2.1]|nr:hypothetical protein GE09DRAFT_317374 [Coniochaeta sp. 2T2.1]